MSLKAGGNLPEPRPHVEDTFCDEPLRVKACGAGAQAAALGPPSGVLVAGPRGVEGHGQAWWVSCAASVPSAPRHSAQQWWRSVPPWGERWAVFTLKSGVEALPVGISGPASRMCLRPCGGNQALAFRDDLLSERLISHHVHAVCLSFFSPRGLLPLPLPSGPASWAVTRSSQPHTFSSTFYD